MYNDRGLSGLVRMQGLRAWIQDFANLQLRDILLAVAFEESEVSYPLV